MFHKKRQTTLNRHSQNWSWQQTFLRQAYSPWTLGMTWEPCLPDSMCAPSSSSSWAMNQHLLTAATTAGLSPNKLLPPPLSCLRSLLTDLYGQILIQALRWVEESAGQLNLATQSIWEGKEYCLCPASWGARTPACSAAMLHRHAQTTPLLAQQRSAEEGSKYHINYEYSPPNPREGLQSLGQPYRSMQFW